MTAARQISTTLRQAPQREWTFRELSRAIRGIKKSTLAWNLSKLSRDRASGVVRIERGVYRARRAKTVR